ncbi:MAG: hypothetical protein GQ524_07550, partial [Anaerolineales bacterium]|nr:hypothetical protein [Anaerolineales bacterium]
LSERVGKAGPDTVVRREAERLVPSESRVTHAGGGDAAGTKSKEGIITVSEDFLPQPMEFVSGENLDDTYKRTLDYYLGKGLSQAEAEAKAFNFLEHQVDNANRAFTSFDTQRGFVIADGTGTGKTYSGALIIDQVFERGGNRVMIIAPNELILKQWRDVLEPLGIAMERFGTKNAMPKLLLPPNLTRGPRGTVYATTYHSMNSWAKNKTLIEMVGDDLLDLVIFDESHFLKNFYTGDTARAIAGVDLSKLSNHALFMSATPMESPLHAGYLLESTGVFDDFDNMLEFLGITRRTEEITRYRGGQKVKTLVETFDGVTPQKLATLNDALVRDGRYIRHNLSFDGMFNKTTGEQLAMYSASVPVPIDPETAMMYQRFMEITENFATGRYASTIGGQRVGVGRSILENGKMSVALDLAQKKVDEGKSVAIFVWRKQGTRFEDHLAAFRAGEKTYSKGSIMPSYYEALISNGISTTSPIELALERFPDAVVISGDVTGKARLAAMEQFNSGQAKVVVATIDAGGTGLSLHDTIGDYARVQINLTVPYTALGVDQTAGRTFRMGSQSHGELYWLYTPIPLEEQYTKRTMKLMERMGALIEGDDAAKIVSDAEMTEFLFAIDDGTTTAVSSQMPSSDELQEIMTDVVGDLDDVRLTPPWEREGWEQTFAPGFIDPEDAVPTVNLPPEQRAIRPATQDYIDGAESYEEALETVSIYGSDDDITRFETINAELDDLARADDELLSKGGVYKERQAIWTRMNELAEEMQDVVVRIRTERVIPERAFYVVPDDVTRPGYNRISEEGILHVKPKRIEGVGSDFWIAGSEDVFERVVPRAAWIDPVREFDWKKSYTDRRGMVVKFGNAQYVLTGEEAIVRSQSSYVSNLRSWWLRDAKIKVIEQFDFDYTLHINKKSSHPYHPSGEGDIHMPMELPDREGNWITLDVIHNYDGSETYVLEQIIPKEDFPAGQIITREQAFKDPVVGHRGVEFKYLDTEYVTSGNTLEVNVVPKSAEEAAAAPSVFDLPPEARKAGDPQPMVVATEAGPQITMFGESIVAGEDFLVDDVHKQAFRIEATAREWIARFGDEAADHGTFLRTLEKDRSRLEGAVARGVFADENAAGIAIKEVQDLINEVNAVASQIKYNIGTQDTLFSVGFIPFFMRPKGVRVQAEASVDAVSHLHAAGNAIDNWYKWLIDGGADDMFKAIPEDDMVALTDWANAAINAKKEIRDVTRHGSANAGELLFVDEVIDGALPETLKVMIDYATEFNIDAVFKHFFPFWKFPTRSIPFWIEAVATHPEILTFWMKYQYMSERFIYQAGAIDSKGRPLNRFKGYIPVPASNNLWWNPLAPLSAKVVLPGDRIVYSDEDRFGSDMSPFEQTVNIAYRWARQMGFNLAPWWEFLIRQSSMIDRDQYPMRTIIPVIDMIPPWVQYDVIQNLRKLHMWPFPDVNYISPQVTWKDYLVERELLGMQLQAMIEAPEMEKAEIAMAAEQAILERVGNPIWDAAQRKVEASEYYGRVVGFFTGIYAKEYTDGEAELRRLRHEINFLYDMINDEVGASIFGLPGDEQERREAHRERRYSVDEGVIYGLSTLIGWTQTPTEGSLSGERRREYVAEEIARQIQKRDYFRYNELIYDTLQSQLMSLPVGAPYELKEKFYDEYGKSKSFAETTSQFELARRTVQHPGPGSDETTWAEWFTETWYGILYATKPNWDKDSETYPEYQQRVAKWKQDLPMIAEQTLPHFQRDLTTLPYDAVWPDLLAISTGTYMDKWDLDNDSAVDALNRVWDDNYWSAFWDEVGHLDGYERDIAEMKFKMIWPMAPTEETLISWVEQVYGSKYTREELREIINSGVMDIESRQEVGKTEHDKMADQVWLWFGWVGPNKSALEKAYFAYGGDPRDWDKWWSSDGDPSAWKDPEEFEKFYGQISAAAGSLGLAQPSMESLEEWAVVQDLHAAYKEEAKMRFGENIFVISAQYSESPRSAQAEFRENHPELEAFWDFRDEYALKHPLWGQYYNASAKASSGSGVAAGSSKSYSSSSASRASRSAAATQTIPTLAYRSTYDIEELMERGPGRGRATRLVKWPVTLQRIVPDELEEEVEQAKETDGSISSAANEYLDYLKDAVPGEKTFIEELQRDLFAHREKPYGAGLG